MNIPLRQSSPIATDLLVFDLQNPRFTPDKKPEGFEDEDIIRFIDRSADLSELLQSMAANGYIKVEPLIVHERDDKYVVLEGNRRLAALKCLRDPNLAERAGVTLPEISQEHLETLDEVLIWRVEDRESAQDLIGYKHINGPRPWDAYAKALFAMRWLEAEQASADGLSLLEIAEKMGDGHDTLRRMVTAAFVIRQAEESEIWAVEDRKSRRFSFSHLYTGLSYSEFTDYLGMDRLSRSEDPIPKPVPEEKKQHLAQLLVWLYGNKGEGEEPVIRTQAKDLKLLRKVLGNKAATRQLEATGGLDDAVITATPRSELFELNVYKAAQSITAALQNQSGFDAKSQPELSDTVKSILSDAESLELIVEKAMRKVKAELGIDD
ncbi:ParB N-terminal domain-containing protein [uncultured Ruegeria sp.]|uniref:ParB N-terminal domain-containing protein n=1 Tax=uncultured Ruegeria sp. TaxID=259304 RepID=UPI002622C8AE|nr:ParB N-terminal domain-containing protein [uncultured Ruegeria sp.]